MKETVFRVLDALARLLLAGVFIYASWTKLDDPGMFAASVANYRMLPPPLVNLVALVLPPVELLSGLALVFTKWSREAALLVFGMMMVFLVGLAQAAVRGLDISCGCFGEDEVTGTAAIVQTIVRDLLLLVPTVWLLVRPGGWMFRRIARPAPAA